MILGLTGGMGCGKSTAAGFFEQLGWRRIDCDQIVRDELLASSQVVEQIRARQAAVVTANNRIDRPALAAIIFRQAAEREWLENLLHPLVEKRWRQLVAAAPDADWIVEVPLLFEKNLQKEFDSTVTVAASSAAQLARLEKRGVSPADALQRISRQLPLAVKIEKSDYVLTNDGTPETLFEQIKRLSSQLKNTH